MNRIYKDAKDKNVAATLVYANDNYELFYDSEFENAVPASDCLELFFKNVFMEKDGVYYRAVYCTSDGKLDFNVSTPIM